MSLRSRLNPRRVAGWAASLFSRSANQNAELQVLREQLTASERARVEDERRLKIMLDLNRALAGASADRLNEHALMESALAALTSLVGAMGCSFVPVDEWQQPLPPFTFGQIPAAVLSSWSTQLAGIMLRERCGTCRVLKSTPGQCPLHPASVGDAMTVFCLPLDADPDTAQPEAKNAAVPGEKITAEYTGRTLGVLHLYMPAGVPLDGDSRALVGGMLPDIALSYQAARMRAQEVVTMRQLQMVNAVGGANSSDFSNSLNGLLEGLTRALEADFVALRLRPAGGERLSNFNVQRGALADLPESALDALLESAFGRVLTGSPAASEPECTPAWLAMPLLLPAGEDAPHGIGVLGMLLVGANRPFTFYPRQQVILQTVASQAALLIENERLIRSLEYKVVIQERARLAREIHDGLAQTLAFLKLQAAQMQSYLAQGDIARLSHVLKENYQVLADAYLDTRQAIDNLRLTPNEGLDRWLEHVLADFEQNTGLPVERVFAPLGRPVSPEIQAHLIRIVQEALSNIRKHAHASHVIVSMRPWVGGLVLEVHDDGDGFDAEDVPESSRHGLRGMRERAEMIGADFQIISQVRDGTIVRLELPACFEEEPSP